MCTTKVVEHFNAVFAPFVKGLRIFTLVQASKKRLRAAMNNKKILTEELSAQNALSARDLYQIYGTSEPPKKLRRIQKGPLSFLYSDAAIRQIEWHGNEVLRAIAWPIRDTSWGTYSPEIVDVNLVESADKVSGQLIQSVDDGRLVSELYFEASDDGEILAQLTLTPVSGGFTTNRAGLTVLHPIQDLAGSDVLVTHPDGSLEASRFPERISPSQPIMDIAGLSYRVGSAIVRISFEGEVFEMEDQRNWSDASFKTYCVPLKHPFTYDIDHTITQTVRISLKGGGKRTLSDKSTSSVSLLPLSVPAPAVGMAIEEGWGADALTTDLVTRCGASHLLVRVTAKTSDDFCARTILLARSLDTDIDLELVLEHDELSEVALHATAARMRKLGLRPARVIALPKAYLDSHQPSGPWPEGPEPMELVAMTKRAFPESLVGGGMLTNFTELNRCTPNPDLCDFITHGSSAIVHASDDLSVIETLEALPQIFNSADHLRGGKPYRLGLVSIGMRSNPYGAAIAENPAQIREAMAREDPRHRGLFGAAWAVGVLEATVGSGIKALCLSAPTGPFGIVYKRQSYMQAGYDDGVGCIYPLYHVVKRAIQLSYCNRVAVEGLVDGLVSYGADTGKHYSVMIANVTGQTVSVRIEQPFEARVLDTLAFDAAVQDPDWLETAPASAANDLVLGAFAIAFITIEKE